MYNGCTKHREAHGGFDCAVYYRDDDNNSGYGEHAQVAYWYGPYSESPNKPVSESDWHTPQYSGMDEFDLACERRHDY